MCGVAALRGDCENPRNERWMAGRARPSSTEEPGSRARIAPSSIRLREAKSNVGRSGKAETGPSHSCRRASLHAKRPSFYIRGTPNFHHLAHAHPGRGPSASFKASCPAAHMGDWQIACCAKERIVASAALTHPSGAQTDRAKVKKCFMCSDVPDLHRSETN